MVGKLSHDIIKNLYNVLRWYEGNKGAGKAAVVLNYYNMWKSLHAFSINVSEKGWKELRKIAKEININIRKRDDDWRFLFAIETYMHLLVRALTLSKLGRTPQNMNGLVRMVNMHRNIFEPSVFEWVFEAYQDNALPHDLKNGLVQNINVALSILYNLNMMTLTFDAFREIYQNILPKEVRRSLGEFYTREDIVDEVLDAAGFDSRAIEELYREWKASQRAGRKGPVILDPACGSGSFLVRVVKRIIRVLGCKPDIAEFVEKTIIGIDINPFAVELAKLNLILAVSDELTKCKATYMPGSVRIYWADSLAIFKNAKNAFNAHVYAVQVPSLTQVIGEEQIRIPAFRGLNLLTVIDIAYDVVSKGGSFLQFINSLGNRVNSETLRIYEGELRGLFKAINSIHNSGNHRLIEFLKNTIIVASLIGSCNFVVGNPPWVRIHNIAKNLMSVLRKNYKYYSKDSVYKPSFRKTKTPFGEQHDYSIAFVERGLQFLRDRGVLSYVITSKVTKAMYAGKMREDLIENYKILEIRDYSLYPRPLFQDAVNYPLIISTKKEKPSKDHGVKVVVANTVGDKRSFETLQSELSLDKSDLKSPWILAPPNVIRVWRKISNSGVRLGDVYEVFMGVKTSADKLYVGELVCSDNGVVTIRLKNGDVQVEEHLIHPFIRGKNVDPYTFRFSEYIIFTHDAKTLEPLWDHDQKVVLSCLGLLSQKVKVGSAGSTLVYKLGSKEYNRARKALDILSRRGFSVKTVIPCAVSACYEVYKGNSLVLKVSFDDKTRSIFVEGLRIPNAPRATRHFLSNLDKLVKRDDYRANLPPWTIFRVSKEKFRDYRIAWQEIAKHFEACILPVHDSVGRLYVPTVTVYFIVEENKAKAVRLLLYLNSEIARAFLKLRATNIQGGRFRHQSANVGCIPVPVGILNGSVWEWVGVPDEVHDLNVYARKLWKERGDELVKELVEAIGITEDEYSSLVSWSRWLNELGEAPATPEESEEEIEE